MRMDTLGNVQPTSQMGTGKHQMNGGQAGDTFHCTIPFYTFEP